MNQNNQIVALVPMRHISERVPEKNFRLLAGKPLYEHIISVLSGCTEISSIVVDTDSTTIMDGLEKRFPQVQIIERPEHLRSGEVSMNEVLLYDTLQVEADFYLQTHSTNPLLLQSTVSDAIKKLLGNYPTFDSLFSVTRLSTRLWDSLGRAINHNPDILLRTQDLPPIYEENSCLYIFTRETLMNKRNRLGNRPMMYEIDSSEAWDIDEEIDFLIVDFLMKQRRASKGL
jgi:CMP-N-acetylneuraminic acid synthetase